MEQIFLIQREWLQILQELRTPFLDQFFLFLNLFDTEYFPLVLLPLAWALLPFPWGARLVYLLTTSSFLNTTLKTFFAVPRPCAHVETLCLVPLTSFSFPSGGAQTAILLGGLLYVSTSSKWLKGVAIAYFLLISFSRAYLGVHYPTDIVGGWLAGGSLLYLYLKTVAPIETFFARISLEKGLFYSLIIPWIGLFLHPPASAHFSMIAASTMGIGLYLVRKYHLSLPICRSWQEGYVRLSVMFFTTLLIYLPLSPLPATWIQELVLPASLLLWISAGMGWVIRP